MPATQGIRVCNFITAQQDSVTTALVSSGLTFANYGLGKTFHWRLFLRVVQAGAGGFRWRINGISGGVQAHRKTWDPNGAVIGFASVTNNAAAQTYTPSDGSLNLIEYEGTGSFLTGALGCNPGPANSGPGP